MRRCNTRGATQADDMWTKVFSNRDTMRVRAEVKPKQVLIKKPNGDTVDITVEYLQGY